LTLTALRTNLTERALAALFGTSQPTAHRTIAALLPLIAGCFPNQVPRCRAHLLLDGTLIPVHDHAISAKSKNYRRSVNAQVISTHDKRILYVGRAWPGNRNDIIVARATVPQGPIYKTDGGYRSFTDAITTPPRSEPKTRRRHIQTRARIEHVLARIKDWQILRQCRRHDEAINHALRAVAYLYNLKFGYL
jgi:hypothetical protein